MSNAEKLAELEKIIAANPPREYDLDNTAEIYRLLSECLGYLKTCHHKHGTDWEGRKFAIDALGKLRGRDFKLVPNVVEI